MQIQEGINLFSLILVRIYNVQLNNFIISGKNQIIVSLKAEKETVTFEIVFVILK